MRKFLKINSCFTFFNTHFHRKHTVMFFPLASHILHSVLLKGVFLLASKAFRKSIDGKQVSTKAIAVTQSYECQ